MKLTWTHIGLVVMGLASASVGFLIKRYQLESGVVTTGKTEVRLKVTVRGTGGRAVKNAKISAFDPEQIVLGTTNADGVFESRVMLKSGKSVILQAEGIAFKMRRDLLIPRSNVYQATTFFDLAEVHEGNATLLSSHNSDSTSLVNKPTPRPEWIAFDFTALKLDETLKNTLVQNLKKAADSMPLGERIKLACTTLQDAPAVHECARERANGEHFSFLVNQFPNIEKEAETWLSEIRGYENPQLEKKVGNTETVFVVRHGNQKVRVYLENMPLQLWKAKLTSGIYRATPQQRESKNNKIELTVITEENQVLQKRISWPTKRKVIITRLPQTQQLNLSRRDKQK
ncbi:MAG: hypothetical protein FJY29_09435 [Betaproteobacteria bacterium]|nr:hypothetical protein [Betaproteobacteria bacterium]